MITVRIGYLVPEFPSQTHIMFWREIAQVEALGVDVDVVSTRVPPAGLQAHRWSAEAQARTVYLARWERRAVGGAARRLSLTRRQTWRELADAVHRSERKPSQRPALLASILLGARLAELASQRNWQHLHVHSCATSADIARAARILGGPPFSLTLHGPLRDYGPDQRAKWMAAEFGIVITQTLRSELEGQLGDSLPEALHVSGMGVNLDTLRRREPYRPWSGDGPVQIFSCGRLNAAKGHLYLIEAVARLRDRGLPVHLTIAGQDDASGRGYKRILDDAIRRLALQDAVLLPGAVPDSEVTAQLHAAHIFALASLEEPLGVAIMEAMAAGTPVIATAAGGVPELITDGEDGLLVPPASDVAIADAVERLVKEPDRATALSRSAENTIQRRMDRDSGARILVSSVQRQGPGNQTTMRSAPVQ